MNSSGIKRGLAAVAIAALAVTGVPGTAFADTSATQQTAVNTAIGVSLRSLTNGSTASSAFDGKNNTVSLVATGGTGVEFVSFFVTSVAPANRVGTSGRTTDGDFQVEWTLPVGLATADVIAVRTDAAGTPLGTNDANSVSTRTGIVLSSTTPTVEINTKATLGYFLQPSGGAYDGTPGEIAGLTGTTSQLSGLLTIPVGNDASQGVDAASADANNNNITLGTITTGTQAWNGLVDVSAAALANSPDQFVPVVQAAAGSRDGQGFNLYAQNIGGITNGVGQVSPDSQTAPVTITVLDQNQQPVSGAVVTREDANGGLANGNPSGVTNGLGQVTFTGATVGTHSYFVENRDSDGNNQVGFTVGIDFRTTATVAASAPASAVFTSRDGDAFDTDEYEADADGGANTTGDGDLRVRVTSGAAGAGNPLVGQRVFYRWTFTPFAGTVPAGVSSAPITVTPDQEAPPTLSDGYTEVPLPTAADFANQSVAVQQTAALIAQGGGTFTLAGYVNNGTNPGQDPTDIPITGTLTVKAGESKASFDGPATTDRQTNTTQTFSGTVALADGTGLVGRTVALTYTPAGGGDAGFSATQPAGTTRLSNSSATAVTATGGAFSVSLTDPAATTPVAETGTLAVDGTATVGTAPNVKNGIGTDADQDPDAGGPIPAPNSAVLVNWKIDATPSSITLRPDYDGNNDGTVGAGEDAYRELVDDAATPGRPVAVQIQLNSTTGTLAGQPVTLTIDNGYFTPNAGAASSNTGNSLTSINGLNTAAINPLTADPAPAEGGQIGSYRDLGQTLTVFTDANGLAVATVAIGRNAGFDDDGRVVTNITARAGGASNLQPIAVAWSTDGSDVRNAAGAIVGTRVGALNPATVTLVPVAQAQQLDQVDVANKRARVGQRYQFDLVTTDQFGNRTKDDVLVGDNTPLASINGVASGAVTVVSQYTTEGAAVTATASNTVAQVITATWTQPTNVYTDADAGTAGFQPGRRVDFTAQRTATDTVNWYRLNFADVDFSLTSSTGTEAEVGEPVTVTLKAVDNNGQPIPGLTVRFIRQGPADQDGDPNFTSVTNANGEAFYSFTGTAEGTARVSAVVSDGEQNATEQINIVFAGRSNPDPEPQPITARIVNNNNGAKADKVVIQTSPAASEAKYDLVRIDANGNERNVVTGRKLNVNGSATILDIVDRNGVAATTYIVRIQATDTTEAVEARNNLK